MRFDNINYSIKGALGSPLICLYHNNIAGSAGLCLFTMAGHGFGLLQSDRQTSRGVFSLLRTDAYGATAAQSGSA